MARLDKIASHDGIVDHLNNDGSIVSVVINTRSACATCEAHSRCGFAESKDKVVDIHTQGVAYTPGEHVIVNISEGRGLLAVWIAYVLPAIIMLAVIISLSMAHMSELVVIIAALAALALYVALLFLLRRHISSRFVLSVQKQQKSDTPLC